MWIWAIWAKSRVGVRGPFLHWEGHRTPAMILTSPVSVTSHQLRLNRRVVFLVVMEGQLAAPNLDVRGGLTPEPNLPTLDFEHRDDDPIPDHDALANLAAQNQHDDFLHSRRGKVPRLGRSRPTLPFLATGSILATPQKLEQNS